MIKNYKQFESLLDKLEGPTKEDIWKNLGFEHSFENVQDFINFIVSNSIKFICIGNSFDYVFNKKHYFSTVKDENNNYIINIGINFTKIIYMFFNINKRELRYILKGYFYNKLNRNNSIKYEVKIYFD